MMLAAQHCMYQKRKLGIRIFVMSCQDHQRRDAVVAPSFGIAVIKIGLYVGDTSRQLSSDEYFHSATFSGRVLHQTTQFKKI